MEYFIFGILVLGGALIAWQSWQALQGKRTLRVKALGRMILQAMGEDQQAQLMRVLGGIRFVFGIFLFGMGLYFMASLAF